MDSLLTELNKVSHDNALSVQNEAEELKRRMGEKSGELIDRALHFEDARVTTMDKPVQKQVEDIESKFDKRVRSLQDFLISYRESLEFTQREVDLLKGENNKLKSKIEELEMEEKRNEYQMKKEDEKLDRQDTMSQRKNLVVEGIAEASNNEKEHIQTIIYALLDAMGVRKDISYDTAHRLGQFTGRKPRAILITFNRI